MRQERRLRRAGEIIRLGGTDYRIGEVEGCGGSSVVYRAEYEDQLNRGSFHQVLIKELFPFHPKGWVYRDGEGNICCADEGREFMESSRRSFYQGNQANLDLLRLNPEAISGNVNSFEAYGTFYSVLAVHGGRSMQELLLEGREFNTLRSAAEGILKLLRALDGFHKNGLLHMDISPDNVLMLPERALLIDYNSVWAMDGRAGGTRFYSVKEGYSAPEVRLQEEKSIGPASDLFSVCAVFFRMLTGRPLGDSDLMGRGVKKCFPRDLAVFRDEPTTAAGKAVQILCRGLHLLARKRYQSAAELEGDFRELILRIDGKGISSSAVWEGSRRSLKQRREPEGEYLEREISGAPRIFGALRASGAADAPGARASFGIPDAFSESGEYATGAELYSALRKGGRFLLHGPGGMGKSRFLTELWKRGMSRYSPREPVVVYVPLMDYQQAGEETRYIRKYLLRHLCFFGQADSVEEAIHQLDQLFDGGEGQGASFILLLDGLNEAGGRRRGLLREIEELGRKVGLGLLVTDRSDSVREYGLFGFETVRLLPLRREAVERAIRQSGVPVPGDERLLELLSSPMLLALYIGTEKMQAESGLSGTGKESAWKEYAGEYSPESGPGPAMSLDALAGRYLDGLCIREARAYSGNQAEQLRSRYLFTHLLPDIAGELKKRRRMLLTGREMYALTERSYKRLRDKNFGLAFPEYMGKSRLMFQGISGPGEWFDYAVSEKLLERLNLLEQTGEGNYRLIHDNFSGCLAERADGNRRRLARYERRRFALRGAAGGAVLGAAVLAALAFQKGQGLSPKEQKAVEGAMNRLAMNLSVLGNEISGQETVVEKAMEDDVLDGEERGVSELLQVMDRKERELERYIAVADGGERWIETLEAIDTGIPLDALQSLYGRPEELAPVIEGAMSHLRDSLCREDSPYRDREKREPVAEAYGEYLKACAQVCYMELCQVVVSLEEETAKELMDAVAQVPAFSPYIVSHPLSGQTEEELERQTGEAARQLEEAKAGMKMQNYDIPAAGW